MTLERAPLLADETFTGSVWCAAHSSLVDAWLASLLDNAAGGLTSGLALVALGGYGRDELCPQSDIDVMLVHRRHPGVASVADRVWYPIWDQGLHLGHSVCTVREALELATDDLDTATALLSARHVAGDETLSAELAINARSQWEKRSRRWLSELLASVEQRHAKAGEVAFHLEPDLKEGRGGLRDVHALRWAELAHRTLLDHDKVSLAAAYSVLLDARVELQRHTRRPGNVLVLQEQDAVATALGVEGADALLARLAEAARVISWTSDDAWRRIASALQGPLRRRPRRARVIGAGVVLRAGEVELEELAVPTDDPLLGLRLAAAAAERHTVIERHSLERLAAAPATLPYPWPPEGRQLLVELLLAGAASIRVIEALDQRGVWTQIIPEWRPVRARPQHNAYHRFTVDRHLLETVANAARLATRTDRPDLLVLAALLHDLGKGYEGDHTALGVDLAKTILARMGFSDEDVTTVAALVEHHLLLPDVATRRDLDDPAIIDQVADAVGSVSRLRLLSALSEADSLATGPAAWGPWKAELMDQLVQRVAQVLGGGHDAGVVTEAFPTEEQLVRLGRPGQHIEADDDVLTIMTDDRSGIFSRVAGVLALHGLDVLRAAAHSSEAGRALAEFRINDPIRSETPWPRIVADLERALDGRLALNARLTERARIYSRSQPSARPIAASVSFDNGASSTSTVIDVHAPDRIGVLYRITRALADLDLDIRSAKVHTLGAQVVDSFYVRDHGGNKVIDASTLGEIERAILHSLSE